MIAVNLKRAVKDGHLVGLRIELTIDLSSMSDTDIMTTINKHAKEVGSIIGQDVSALA